VTVSDRCQSRHLSTDAAAGWIPPEGLGRPLQQTRRCHPWHHAKL